jgi:hypothetical protein
MKMCLSETYSKIRVDKSLSDMFPIENGLKKADALSSLLLHFALEYVINRVQVNQDGLKLSGTHHLLDYTDDVNILGRNVRFIKRNAEVLVGASKETGLEVTVDKNKYMVMFRDQNAGRSHTIKTENKSFERVEQFKYLGTTLTNENTIQKMKRAD